MVIDTLHLVSETFSILQAHNGKAAIEILKENKVDLVITDIQMPQMDGFQLARWISENRKDVSIIMMSGNPKYADLVAAKHNAIEFFAKPFDVDRVKRILETTLQLADAS